MSQRVEHGDWQTPPELAAACVARLVAAGVSPRTVLEPTCGRGAFLAAARDAWPRARLVGHELRADYVEDARATGAEVHQTDFFDADWDALTRDLEPPVLVLGNPPWVTSAALGALGSSNRPRARVAGVSGLDAVTGRSNFDVSEHVVARLLDAFEGEDFTLAMLLKTAVARRIAERRAVGGEVRGIDARRWFGAAVDGALVTASPGPRRWKRFSTLDALEPTATWGVVDGTLTLDLDAFERTRTLAGTSDPAWRSGIKHDAAAVMELARDGAGWRSRAGGAVSIEADRIHPLFKGGDLARGIEAPTRGVIVTQTRLGEPTAWMREALPRTWAYLEAHRAALDGRKSRIYRGQPDFAMFGVGAYAFAPFKVAVAGLYPDLAFRLVGPHDGKPTLLDDTCYFLPFEARADAERALRALSSEAARAFFAARTFVDAKRPVTKQLLMALDWRRVASG
ncbi:MAG: SAM-dependent methyltransferase [Sandaracinaceae bacterium]|nr:SAM-dependent methyltransferase [Sandaracinaceae bacterium]